MKLQDPAKDALTVISPAGIEVDGATVQAGLVAFGAKSPGVVFLARSRVLGPVVSARMFRAVPGRFSGAELGQCELGTNGAVDEGDVSKDVENYTALFSPYPVTREHSRE